ncbi:PASTA domain-containing protein [Lentzea chajnantorensis]
MKIVIALLVLVLAGCGNTPPPGPTAQSTPTVAEEKVPKVVELRLAEAREVLKARGYRVVEEDATGQRRPVLEPRNWVVTSQLPEAGADAPGGTEVVLEVRKPTDASTSLPPPAKGTVPNVVCLDLQKAQDTLQAAGFFVLSSEDATGQGRRQVADRNWVVVSQSAAAGSTPEATVKITLGAVKLGEPTGASGCPS